MALTTRDGLIAALAGSQDMTYYKSASRTTVAGVWFSMFDLAGNPGAGVLAGTSTAAGVVPDDTVPGTIPVNSFSGSNTGYVSNVDYGSSVACRFRVYDMLFKAGAFTFSASGTLSGQPSYSSRVPGGDYDGLQIWLETVTAFTGNQSINITYTNQSGVVKSTGVIATGAAPTVGRLFQVPLAAGDTGVQQINGVVSTVATVGTFNVLVLRRLVSCRVRMVNDGGVKGPDLTGLPIVYSNSALYVMVATDSTATGVPELQISVING
jgi:hypothetical protein